MSRSSIWVLQISAVWALWVWVVLIRNMINDHSHGTSFRVVHIVLAVISIGFAVATFVIAQQQSRRSPRDHA